jgi:hypothetical protein
VVVGWIVQVRLAEVHSVKVTPAFTEQRHRGELSAMPVLVVTWTLTVTGIDVTHPAGDRGPQVISLDSRLPFGCGRPCTARAGLFKSTNVTVHKPAKSNTTATICQRCCPNS